MIEIELDLLSKDHLNNKHANIKKYTNSSQLCTEQRMTKNNPKPHTEQGTKNSPKPRTEQGTKNSPKPRTEQGTKNSP